MNRWLKAILNLMLTSVANPCAAEFLAPAPGIDWTCQDAAAIQPFADEPAHRPANELLLRVDESRSFDFLGDERKMDILLAAIEPLGRSWQGAAHQAREVRRVAGRGRPARFWRTAPLNGLYLSLTEGRNRHGAESTRVHARLFAARNPASRSIASWTIGFSAA